MYQTLVAELAGQRGEALLAYENYLKVARTTRDPRAAARALHIAGFMGDQQKALAAAQLWGELDPQSLAARQGVVELLLRAGEASAALPHLEELLSLLSAPLSAGGAANAQEQAFLQIAVVLGKERNRAAALTLMGMLAARHENNPYAQFAYSNLAAGGGEYGVARQAVDKALALKPGWANAVLLRARILQLQGDLDGATAYLAEALKAAPRDQLLRMTYARLLVDGLHLEQARAQLKEIARQAGKNGEVLLALGVLSMQMNQPQDAERYLKQAVKFDAQRVEASYYLGQLAETRKQYAQAIEWYQAVNEGDAYLDAQLRIGKLIASQGDVERARAHVRAIPLRDPAQQPILIQAEAELLRDQKRYAEAMQVYDDALAVAPDHVNLLYGRAMLAEKMDRLDLLERDLRAILQRDPNNAEALNALGYTLADRNLRLEEARALIQRALELRPQDPATLDSMGWVLYRLGQHQEALTFLQSAYALSRDAEIAAHLGEVLWMAGDREQARKVWREALKSEPEHGVLRETMKRFNQPM
jgi:tetratricopeptide (TPR) repeat protein